jgi:hypothetical protein
MTRKDSSQASAITCQNCAVYSFFPSGITSHSKIAQFNRERIGRFTEKSLLADPFWLPEITTDPHILADLNIECPDDRFLELNIRTEICAVLGFYAAYSGSLLSTFRDSLSVPCCRAS